MKMLLALVLCTLVYATSAVADEEQRYNQVRLQAQKSESVSNDTMHVGLSAYAEHRDAASLAEQINEDMEWALAIVSEYKDVKASTGGYRTWPVHRDNVMKGWRAQQTLSLESRDIKVLSQ